MSRLRLHLCLWAWMAITAASYGVQRFPPPQFDTPYTIPTPTTPAPKAAVWEIVDVAVLAAAMALAAWLILKKRSRGWIVALMLFSLAYFGFWRQGCICAVGSIGNVTLAVFDKTYILPLTVLAFFLLPILFTLFFGRVFCGAVCPLGMIQDLVLIRPMRVPPWLEAGLRLMVWLYLGLAVLMAATASGFIICRDDPFVGFFRFGANPQMWVISGAFVLVSIFIGRPYCRFVCPYGLILRQAGRLSKYRATITPDECIHCRLCEDACPFGAIETPTADWPDRQRAIAKRRVRWLIAALPMLILAGGWLGYKAAPLLARSHPTVQLADRIGLEEAGLVMDTTDESAAFRTTGRSVASLYAQAEDKERQFTLGTTLVGAAMGLLCGLTVIRTHLCVRRDDYQTHRAGCFACGRCFAACPREHLKQKQPQPEKAIL